MSNDGTLSGEVKPGAVCQQSEGILGGATCKVLLSQADADDFLMGGMIVFVAALH